MIVKLLRWGVSFSSGLVAIAALAQTIDPYYAGQYQLTSLGSVPGVPLRPRARAGGRRRSGVADGCPTDLAMRSTAPPASRSAPRPPA